MSNCLGWFNLDTASSTTCSNRPATTRTGVPDAAADAAQDTIGAAAAAADRLPPHLGDALRDVAENAFARGMQVSATAGVAALLVVAVVPLLVLRRADTTSI
jgi:MFS transporter, DHA2 family, multidrug resistance protein